GEGAEEDDAEDESDVLRWQVPFVMGRLCAELGRDPRRVLENLADALRLAQAEHVPLEDELEALCRLHAARAELVLSGDLSSFVRVAPIVEAFTFRENADSDDDEEQEGDSSYFSPPPAMFSTVAAGDGNGGGEAAAGAGDETAVDIRQRRLEILENCMDAFESCLDKHKGQHTAMFAMANALYRGASIAEDARQVLSSAEAMSMMQKNLGMMQKKKRAFGSQGGLVALKPLFEKRQAQLLAIGASDGVVGPGLALLSSRRRKLNAVKRKYYALYVEILEATKSTSTLQGLLRRTKGARESREEMLWVQGRVLRGLVTILKSEIQERALSTGVGAASAAAAPHTPGASATAGTAAAAASSAAAAAPGGAEATASTAAGPQSGEKLTEAQVFQAAGNPSVNGAQVGGAAGLAAPPSVTQEAGATSSPAAAATAVGSPVPVSEVGKGAGAVVDSAVGTADDRGKLEKLALENAWNLYLQVVDLESSSRSGSSAGGGGGGSSSSGRVRPRASSSTSSLTLLREAEDVLVKSWQAFRAAKPTVVELVELQNPLPSPGKVVGSGPTGAESPGGILLRRARLCCHVFWPDKQGRGKLSKSKLKLKRPAAAAALPQASSANRGAPRPKVQNRPTSSPPPGAAAAVAGAAAAQQTATGNLLGAETR
ncbi:unnamed protein product, partial [Hapterophycus canaliculatus]